MRLSVERELIINYLLDLALLACALRPMRRLVFHRLALAAAVGAAGAVLLQVIGANQYLRASGALLLAPFMVLLAAWPWNLRGVIGASAALMAASALVYSLASLLPEIIPWWPRLFLCCALAGAILGRRKRWLSTWEAQVYLSFGGKSTRFSGIIDSGNKLREPLSSLEVLVVEQRLLSGLLPGDFDPAQAWRTLPSGYRMVAYGGVGGTGELACFMPDELLFSVDGRLKDKSGSIWVAVYPRELPGKAGALLPPAAME